METLIYVAIIGVAISSFIAFALSIINSRSKVYAVQEVQANIRTVLGIITQKIRLAEDVIAPIEGNSDSILILDMPGVAPDLIFSVTGGILSVAEGVGDPVSVTSDEVTVSNLTFTNLALDGERDNIRMEYTIEYKEGSSKEYQCSQYLQTAVSLRQ